MKKFLSVIIICLIIMSLIFIPAMAQSEMKTEHSSLMLLKTLGIIDEDVEDSQVLKRELMASIVVRMSGRGSLLTEAPSENRFSDVEATNVYYKYILTACKLGFMYGTAETTFSPEMSATSQQAAKVLMNVLGYPNSKSVMRQDLFYYENLARTNDLYKNLDISDTSSLTVGEFSVMVDNALEARMMEKEYPNDTYKKTSKTMLNDIYGLNIVMGVVMGANNGEIQIDSTLYKNISKMKDVFSLLGRRVKAYVNRDSEIVYINSSYFNYEYFTINSESIVKIDNGTMFYEHSENSQKCIKVDNLNIFYNGTRKAYNPDDFILNMGMVTLLGDGSGKWTSVIINEYDIMVYHGFAAYKFFDCFDDTKVLDVKNKDYDIFLGGEKIGTDELQKYDVLKVYEYKDKYIINVTRKIIEGRLTGYTDKEVTVYSRNYKISDYFRANCDIRLDETADFIIDGDCIIAAAYTSDNWYYGYFFDIQKFGNLNSVNKIKMFTGNNEFEEFVVPDKINLNGTSVKVELNNSENALVKALKTQILKDKDTGELYYSDIRNDFVRQLIKYRVNLDNEITYICTAQINSSNENSLLVDTFFKSQYFKGTGFMEAYCMDENLTDVFYVPISSDNEFDDYGSVNISKRNASSEESYYHTNKASSILSNDETYVVSAFDVTEGGLARCIIVDNDKGRVGSKFTNTQSNIVVVKEIVKKLNKNEEPVYCIKGISNKRDVEYTEKESGILSSDGIPKPGDVIQVETDLNGEAVSMAYRYSYQSNVLSDNPIYGGNVYGHSAGQAYSFDDYGVRLRIKNINQTTGSVVYTIKSYGLSGITNIYKVDRTSGNVTLGAVNEIVPYIKVLDEASMIFVRATYGIATEMVIYD